MDQRLIQVEDEQLIEACFFKLELDLFYCRYLWELFYLLNGVYGLDDLNGDVFIDGDFEGAIREVLILFKYFFRVQRCRV